MQRQPQGSCAARQQIKPYTKPLTSKLHTCIWWSVKEFFFALTHAHTRHWCELTTLCSSSVSHSLLCFLAQKMEHDYYFELFFHHLWPPVTRDKYIQLEIAIGCSVWNLFRKGKIFKKKGKCQSCKNLIGHLRFICKKIATISVGRRRNHLVILLLRNSSNWWTMLLTVQCTFFTHEVLICYSQIITKHFPPAEIYILSSFLNAS